MTVECRNVQMSKILFKNRDTSSTEFCSYAVLFYLFSPDLQCTSHNDHKTTSILIFLGFYEPSECKWINTKQLPKKYT